MSWRKRASGVIGRDPEAMNRDPVARASLAKQANALELRGCIAPAWAGWQFTVAAAIITIGVCYLASFLLPSLFGRHEWFTSWDAKWTTMAAQQVSWGNGAYLYSAVPQWYPLPGFLILMAPVVALGDHFQLVNNAPLPLPYPSMWLVVAPFFFAAGASCLLGIDYLAHVLDIPTARRRLITIATGLCVVVPTCVWAGHPEDLVALGLSCISLAFVIRVRYPAAAVVLTVAVLMQPWAGLLIPILVAASPAGQRLRVFLLSTAPPAIVAAALLAIDYRSASTSLLLQPVFGVGQHLPWWNFGVHRLSVTEVWGLADARVGSEVRIFALLTALCAAIHLRRRPGPDALLRASAITLLARGVFELQIWSWYLAPAAVLLILLVAVTTVHQTARLTLGVIGAGTIYFTPFGAYSSYFHPLVVPTYLALGLLVGVGAAIIAISHSRPLATPPWSARPRSWWSAGSGRRPHRRSPSVRSSAFRRQNQRPATATPASRPNRPPSSAAHPQEHPEIGIALLGRERFPDCRGS